MDDIYQNRISYHHDGSNSLKDRFTFTVGDGTNMFFIIEEGGKEVSPFLKLSIFPWMAFSCLSLREFDEKLCFYI